MLVLAGCDEKEAPLQFEVMINTSPEATDIRYYCPDLGPFRGDKEYFVVTDFSASEVKFQCTNAGPIHIETSLEAGGNISTDVTPEEAGIFVTLERGNVIAIRFEELESENRPFGYYGTITVYGKVDKKEKYTKINLSRTNPRLWEGL